MIGSPGLHGYCPTGSLAHAIISLACVDSQVVQLDRVDKEGVVFSNFEFVIF